MNRLLAGMLVLATLVASRGTVGAAPLYEGEVKGDLGITGCFIYANTASRDGIGCIVALRIPSESRVDVTVRLPGETPKHASLPLAALRRGIDPQNYVSILLTADVPGVGHLDISTEDQSIHGPAYSNVGCWADPPLTLVLASVHANVGEAGISGWIEGDRIVRYGAGCSARFDGDTVGHWVMS